MKRLQVIAHNGRHVMVDETDVLAWAADCLDENNSGGLHRLLDTALSIGGQHPSLVRLRPQGHGVMLCEHGGVWMCQRIAEDDIFRDYWACYGGRVEEFEDIFSSASRELQEETGLRIPPQDLKHVHTGEYVKPDGMKFWAHLFATAMRGHVIENKEPHKHGPPTLIPWEEFGERLIMPVMRDALELGLVEIERQRFTRVVL